MYINILIKFNNEKQTSNTGTNFTPKTSLVGYDMHTKPPQTDNLMVFYVIAVSVSLYLSFALRFTFTPSNAQHACNYIDSSQLLIAYT